MIRFALFLPVALFVALSVVLLLGLDGDPTELPSALVGEPFPAFKLEALDKTPAEKPAEKLVVAEKKSGADAAKSELPATVANARAQALAEDQARNFAALDSTDVPIVDGVQLAAADQLTDADRAATATTEAAQDSSTPTAPAASEPAPVPSGKIIRAVSASEKPVFKTDDGDPWSKTSLIGKIFIAFGSLLTLASAARLLIT